MTSRLELNELLASWILAALVSATVLRPFFVCARIVLPIWMSYVEGRGLLSVSMAEVWQSGSKWSATHDIVDGLLEAVELPGGRHRSCEAELRNRAMASGLGDFAQEPLSFQRQSRVLSRPEVVSWWAIVQFLGRCEMRCR